MLVARILWDFGCKTWPHAGSHLRLHGLRLDPGGFGPGPRWERMGEAWEKLFPFLSWTETLWSFFQFFLQTGICFFLTNLTFRVLFRWDWRRPHLEHPKVWVRVNNRSCGVFENIQLFQLWVWKSIQQDKFTLFFSASFPKVKHVVERFQDHWPRG